MQKSIYFVLLYASGHQQAIKSLMGRAGSWWWWWPIDIYIAMMIFVFVNLKDLDRL